MMEECNGPEPEKFPEDHHIYKKEEKDEEDSEKPPSPRAHLSKVFKKSHIIYHETPA